MRSHHMSQTSISQKHQKLQIDQNAKTQKTPKCENEKHQKVSKNIKNMGGLNPALKPGPVVPPGIEKTPDQAARNSQSVDFGHLSDILAFFRGGSIFDHFLCFSCFAFSCFCVFTLF